MGDMEREAVIGRVVQSMMEELVEDFFIMEQEDMPYDVYFMEQGWSHWISAMQCEACWNLTHPNGRVPVRLEADFVQPESCCTCGTITTSGIYVRTLQETQN